MDDALPPNPYQTLNIPKDADSVTIEKAYRKLILLCHPDRVLYDSEKKQAAERFQQVQQAYEILSDEIRRKRYDDKVMLSDLKTEVAEEQGSLSSRKFTENEDTFKSRNENWGSRLNEFRKNLSSQSDSGYGSSPSANRSSSSSSSSGYPSAFDYYPTQSYQNQSYPVPNNPATNFLAPNYASSSQLSQQRESYYYNNQRNPEIELVRTAERRKLSTLSPTSPSAYPCLHPGCGHISSRPHDLKRHMVIHFPRAPEELLDCRYQWCGRTGAHGFRREDHRKEHYRKTHMKESDFSMTSKGGRSYSKKLGLRSSPAVSDKIYPDGFLDIASQRLEGTDRISLAIEDGLSPLGDSQASGLSTESLARLDEGTSFNKENESGSRSDDEGVHEHPTETGSSGTETLTAPMSRHTTQDIMAVIRYHVCESLSASEAGLFCASLKIQWDILGFMEEQFRDNDFPNTALGPVVTISGSAQHAQAMTCSDYIRQSWPTHGLKVLNALQDALDSPTHTSQSELVTRIDHGSASSDGAEPSHAELDIDVTQKKLFLKISSTSPEVIADVVQQLIWMGAALQTSRDNRIQYCDPVLEGISKPKGAEATVFNVLFDMRSPAEEEQSCWFPLFTNPVIAHGFPTAHRSDDEVGLEIPLEMMAALGGVRHAVDYEGGLVLKGYSTLLVPIKCHKESVQWHLIHARGDDRVPYCEASAQCPNRALLKDLNHEALKTTRAYLGWWKDADIHLGTADADYESIDWSKAKEPGPSIRLTCGTVGISKIFTASVNFVLGAKDGSFHYSQRGPFQKTIDRAENTPVVLYDQHDRRAWLVSALSVLLHIIQLRNHIKPFVVGGNPVHISPVDPSRQGHAAREVVTRNKSQKLFDPEWDEEKDYCFKDAVLDYWSNLDLLMEKEATNQATPGIPVHDARHSTLYGWELRAITNEDRTLKQKAQVLEKTAGRWYDLVKDVDSIVLFASGLGDIIKPRSDLDGLCQQWRKLPKNKDYLAVGVPMLESFYAKAGHRQDHQYLTTAELQWHRSSTLFEQCSHTTPHPCACDRIQEIYHHAFFKTSRRVEPPGKLEENGCVIFGQVHHSLKPTKPVAIMKNAIHKFSPAPLSPERKELNGDTFQSPKRPPSLTISNDELVHKETVARERRFKISHTQTPKPDPSKGSSDCDDHFLFSDNLESSHSQYQSLLRHHILPNEQNLRCTETDCASRGEHAPSHAQKTIRHKASNENYSDLYGCTCPICFSEQIEPLDGMGLVGTNNGARDNLKNTAERRQGQPV